VDVSKTPARSLVGLTVFAIPLVHTTGRSENTRDDVVQPAVTVYLVAELRLQITMTQPTVQSNCVGGPRISSALGRCRSFETLVVVSLKVNVHFRSARI
jgi:hypothetical protein